MKPPEQGVTGLRRNFGWALGGRVVYGATQFALLVVLARMGSVSAVGAFAFALAFTAPPMVFANLQLRSLYATDVTGRFAWSSYVGLRRRATLAAFAVVATALLLLPTEPELAWATLWVALAKAFETCSDLHYGVFQRHGEMDRFGRSLALRGIVGVTVVAAVLGLGGSLPWAMAAMAAWWGVLLLCHDAPSATRLRVRAGLDAGTGSMLQLAWQAAPMGLVFLLDSLHQNIPRYFVEAELGTVALGLFTPMVYMITIGSAFVFALGAPAAPLMARYAADRNAAAFSALAYRTIRRGGVLGVLGVAAAALFGRWVLELAYGPAYAAESPAFVFVAVSGALHFMMVPTILALTSARRLLVQLLVYLLASAAACVASAALVPCFGLVGAALAGVAGMSVGTTVALLCLRRAIAVLRDPASAGRGATR
ncbi:MAG: lipopolysaccharide biosynthesis protein [Deltaproteobacteria bacterium]|nr:lipopolysaccharide biosynthesis protein [Nannocystaceae bacterium]